MANPANSAYSTLSGGLSLTTTAGATAIIHVAGSGITINGLTDTGTAIGNADSAVNLEVNGYNAAKDFLNLTGESYVNKFELGFGLTINLAGGTINQVNGIFYFGVNGSGSMNMNGASVFNGNSGGVQIGWAYSGILNLYDSATVVYSGSSIDLGANNAGKGYINQFGSATLVQANSLNFGTSGNDFGVYNLNSGLLSVGTGGINVYTGASGTVNFLGGSLSAMGNFTVASSTAIPANSALAINFQQNAILVPSGYTITLNRQLTGPSGLLVTGAGTVTLNNTNTYGGGNTISNGAVLQLGNAGSTLGNTGSPDSLGSGSHGATGLVLDGGTLQSIDGNMSTDRLFTITPNSGTLDASNYAGTTLTFTNTNAIAFVGNGNRSLTLQGNGSGALALQLTDPSSASLTGSLTLVKNGIGTWVLSNSGNNYSGGTCLDAGSLGISSGVLGTGPVYAQGGAILPMSGDLSLGNALVIGTLSYSASNNLAFTGGGSLSQAAMLIANGNNGSSSLLTVSGTMGFLTDGVAGTLTLNGTNTGNNTLSSTITDNDGGLTLLVKSGAGTWVLAANNSYTGGTTVSAGTLWANADSATGNGNVYQIGGTLGIAAPDGNNALGGGVYNVATGTVVTSGVDQYLANNLTLGTAATTGIVTFAGSNNLFLTGGLTLGTSNFITANGTSGNLMRPEHQRPVGLPGDRGGRNDHPGR